MLALVFILAVPAPSLEPRLVDPRRVSSSTVLVGVYLSR